MNFKVMMLAGLLFAGNAYAEDYGVVTDLKGKASEVGSKKGVVIGQSLPAGMNCEIAEKATMVLVEYASCSEWMVKGPATVKLSPGEPKVVKGDKKGTVHKSATLGACYKPAEIKSASSHDMGGLVLMSGEGENLTPGSNRQSGATSLSSTSELEGRDRAIDEMKKEAAEQRASASTLMMLTIHFAKRHDRGNAALYLEQLKKRTPDSAFVRQMEGELERNPEKQVR